MKSFNIYLYKKNIHLYIYIMSHPVRRHHEQRQPKVDLQQLAERQQENQEYHQQLVEEDHALRENLRRLLESQDENLQLLFENIKNIQGIQRRQNEFIADRQKDEARVQSEPEVQIALLDNEITLLGTQHQIIVEHEDLLFRQYESAVRLRQLSEHQIPII